MKQNHKTSTNEHHQATSDNRVATGNNKATNDQRHTNYASLGLKCGLEIHQQLDGRKLFCRCPCSITGLDASPDAVVKRKIRAATGELGEVDVVAVEESTKGRNFFYEFFNDHSCLVELDECPPYPLSENALKTTIQVSKLLNAHILDGVQFMRKTIVDGSNTSGFQRTGLVARTGFVHTSHGKVGINSVVLEEDSARIIKEASDSVVYRLDRLGIPLIEITTAPDIKSPEQCRETAETLGLLLRSTGNVKRGIGTIRQDVNISIKDGARVELKGVQDLRHIPSIIDMEISRQQNLLKLKDEFKKRNFDRVKEVIVYMTDILKNSESKIIKSAIEKKGAVVGLKIENFAGLFGFEVQPNKRFGTEISDRAKSLAGVGGIFHSDELPKYGITVNDVSRIKTLLGCKANDGFVMVADEKDRAVKSIKVVIDRIHEVLNGVPAEVRRVNADLTSSFERHMPGSARMYPETDIPLVHLSKDLLAIPVPELIQDKALRYEKFGIGKDLADALARSEQSFLFDHFVKQFKNLKPSYIAECLISFEKNMKRNFNIDVSLTEEDYMHLFDNLNNDKISKESVVEILKEKKPVKDIIHKYFMMSDKQLVDEIQKILQQSTNIPSNAVIGKVMSQLRGKAQGQKIVEFVNKLLKK